MENAENLKEMVREKYGQLAREGESCCGPTSCCGPSNGGAEFVDFSEDYRKLNGYVAEADLGLGCGIPTEGANLSLGQTVLDLGSGAGNDVFVARSLVGDKGKVIGVDMTPAMIKKARQNAEKMGYKNVEFRLGEIEALPIESGSIDRILSNCVLNLVPNKAAAFKEMFRVMKSSGRFSISDIVLEGEFPDELRKAAELYVGCVSGAIQKQEYLAEIGNAGFESIAIVKEKTIVLPEDLLKAYLTDAEREVLKQSKVRILSVTVQGQKSQIEKSQATEPCCVPLTAVENGPCC